MGVFQRYHQQFLRLSHQPLRYLQILHARSLQGHRHQMGQNQWFGHKY